MPISWPASKIVVGIIIFVIIIVIQFVVITKGATRISEVAARFALDGMPGKQMAIDADLNAGIIDEREAQTRRAEITRQADFYGAMDGASKFVRGDAIAGIIITVINIVGGLIIGMAEHGMPLAEAARVLHAADDRRRPGEPGAGVLDFAGGRLARDAQHAEVEHAAGVSAADFLAAAGAGGHGRLPGHSRFHELAARSAACARRRVPRLVADDDAPRSDERRSGRRSRPSRKERQAAEERVEDYLTVDPMEIELGVGLIRLADPNRGGDLLDRVQRVRQNIAGEIGILMPKVRIRDNMRLDANQYRIKIADMPVAQGELEPTLLLAIDSGVTTRQGRRHRDEGPGVRLRREVDQSGAGGPGRDVWATRWSKPAAVLATHLTEVCRRHADEILTRDATKHLVDELKTTSPTVVSELIPSVMSLAEVQAILHLLLREQVSIRQLSVILETLGDYAPRSKDPILLTEYVRHRLARQICTRYRNAEGELYVVAFDPALEDRIRAGFEHTERGLFIRMSPQAVEATCRAISERDHQAHGRSHTPIVLVSPQIRAAVKRLTENHLPQLVVLSFNEVTRDTKIVTVGMVADGRNDE